MFEQSEFKARRETLLAQMPNQSIAIVAASPEQHRSGDTYFRFRQNSHFYYLTGFEEPEALLVLIKDENPQYILFNRANKKEQEIWHGLREGQEGVCKRYGVDKAYPFEKIDELLPELLSNRLSIYYCHGQNSHLDNQIASWCQQVRSKVRTGISAPQEIINLEVLLNEMRLFKSEKEIQAMRYVAELSADAHTKAMQQCKHLNHEYQLEAILTQQFLHHGCKGAAYDSIVGNGANACILHYTENSAPLEKGNLVLIDAGGEYYNYAADITRTFPINGRFSEPQKAIYELVLRAQKAGIECIKPGAPWHHIQQTMIEILTQGLCELGLLQGNVTDLIESKDYQKFYMHNSGHWLGLDVHDVGNYKVNGQWRPLQAGMVLTVEPGLYIQGNNSSIDKKWWDIGVRIEDDVLVTENGYDVLTDNVVKEVDDIEQLMA